MNSHTEIPAIYIEHLTKQLPTHININEIITACKTPLRLSARVNVSKITVDECKLLWQKLGWQAEPLLWTDNGFWLDPLDAETSVPLGNTFAHAQGLFYLQEASSMLPATAFTVNDTSELILLDMAAAPGSKTTQLANLFPNSHIVANELSASRLKSLHHNLLRCGHPNHTLTNFNANVFGEYQAETYDKILLDAPCSGEGTVRRDPDALKTWTPKLSLELAALQQTLLVSAIHALKTGGELVYSTCTLSLEENQYVLKRFLEAFAGVVEVESLADLFPMAEKSVTPEGYLHVFPQLYNTGGFFVAKLRKIAKTTLPSQKQAKVRKAVFTPLSKRSQTELSQFMQAQFGFDIQPFDEALFERDKEIWWLPANGQKIANKIHVSRSGIKIGDIIKNGFRLNHEAVCCFGHHFKHGVIDVTQDEATAYLQGKDIVIAQPERLQGLPMTGDLVIFYRHFPLGCAKRIKNRLKNALPRDKVRDKPYL